MNDPKKLLAAALAQVPEVEGADAKSLATEMSRATAEFHIAVYGGYTSKAELERKALQVLALTLRTYRVAG